MDYKYSFLEQYSLYHRPLIAMFQLGIFNFLGLLLITSFLVECSKLEELVEALESEIDRTKGMIFNSRDYPQHYYPRQDEEFDFVVVGGGSAGCVVANRLTEEGGWRVLLVEAGGDPPVDSEAPALWTSFQLTDVDWQYETDPAEGVCLSHVNKSCRWPRGKVLGGSSVINSMLYTRGNSRDYDEWEAAGNEGWGYSDVLPYFRKSEDLRSPWVLRMKDALKYHGTGGDMTVENWIDEGNPLSKLFRTAFEDLGYPFNPDYNAGSQSGYHKLQGSLRDHKRCSNAKAFLSPAKNRDNLKVSKKSLATKILIGNTTLTAYGVEFIDDHGRTIRVQAKKEVILSAGAINSPQILMLSGVGQSQHLADLGITVVKDLPVGRDLQDHPFINLVFAFDKSPLECPNLNTPSNASARSTLDFLLNSRSSLSVNGLYGGVFINTTCRNGFPYIQGCYFYYDVNSTSAIRASFERASYDEEVIDQMTTLNQNHFVVTWTMSLVKVYSRGEIRLKTSDPRAHPVIKTGYFTDPRDVNSFLEVFDLFTALADTDVVKRSGAKLVDIRVAACEKFGFPSRKYRECYLRHLLNSAYHPSCTCGMGRVVDSQLRVKGVNRLRVVDASVMVNVNSGNTNAPVTMIAEKACDIIKSAWT